MTTITFYETKPKDRDFYQTTPGHDRRGVATSGLACGALRSIIPHRRELRLK